MIMISRRRFGRETKVDGKKASTSLTVFFQRKQLRVYSKEIEWIKLLL